MPPRIWRESADARPAPALPRINRLAKGSEVMVWLLGPWLHAFTHFNSREERSYLCMDDDCRYCKAGVPQKWKGYAPCLLWYPGGELGNPQWEPVCQEITGKIQQLAFKPELIGCTLDLSHCVRKGKKGASFLAWRLSSEAWQFAGPPPVEAWDPLPSVLSFYGTNIVNNAPPPKPAPSKPIAVGSGVPSGPISKDFLEKSRPDEVPPVTEDMREQLRRLAGKGVATTTNPDVCKMPSANGHANGKGVR